jgi:CRP/FNR family transcriptional regulator, cyclic AMP receptor protein
VSPPRSTLRRESEVVVQTLRRPSPLPLTNGLAWPARIRLAEAGRLVYAGEQEVLSAEGEVAGSWHFLETGAVALSVTSVSGRRSVLAILAPGDAFGPPAADSSFRPEARAIVGSKLLVVPIAAVDDLVRRDGAIAAWLSAALLRQSDQLLRRLASLLMYPVVDRVLAAFHDLASRHGRRIPSGTLIPLPLPQEMLAEFVGVTRESVNRAIRTLESRGAIRRSGLCYSVLGPLFDQGAGGPSP